MEERKNSPPPHSSPPPPPEKFKQTNGKRTLTGSKLSVDWKGEETMAVMDGRVCVGGEWGRRELGWGEGGGRRKRSVDLEPNKTPATALDTRKEIHHSPRLISTIVCK